MEKFFAHYYLYQYLEPKDLVLTSLALIIIYFVVNSFKGAILGQNVALKKFFLPALTLKMAGAILSGLVYQYYYHGGDTMEFYTSASFIHGLFFEHPLDALGFFSASPVYSHPQLEQYNFLPFIYDPPTWTVIRIASFVNFFAFDSYPVLAIYFSLFSMYCSWKFFTLLCELYPDPKLIKRFAYCLFYIPSVFFWGSGVFKDSLTLSGLFLCVYHIYQIVIRRNFAPLQFIWLIIGVYLMFSIRLFFLLILLPCIGFWLFAEFRDKVIKSNFIRAISFPLLLGVAGIVIIIGLGRVIGSDDELGANALMVKAQGFQSWHGSLGGSAYDLGVEDYSVSSLIRVFPLAVNVTLFRPYLFIDTHTSFQIIAGLQSLFFLYYFGLTLLRTRLGFFTAITQDSMILFSLVFSIFYAFVAGFTSYNFGALDRYKIPALPFFMIALVLINYKHDLQSSIKRRGA